MTPLDVNCSLEHLTVVVSSFRWKASNAPTNSVNPVLPLMQHCWPILTRILERFGGEASVAENISRCHKHAMRNCGDEFSPLLPSLMQQIGDAFSKTFVSSYLYLASICVTEFGSSQSHGQAVLSLVEGLSNIVNSRFVGMEQLNNFPDVAEEFFYLLSRYVGQCPEITKIGGSFLIESINRVILGMRMQHREANRGALNFMDSILDCARNSSRGNNLTGLLNACGPEVVTCCLKCFTGSGPIFYLDRGSCCLCSVLFKLCVLSSEHPTAAVDAVKESKQVVEWAKASCKQLGFADNSFVFADLVNLLQHASDTKDRRSFDVLVLKFISKASRERRRIGG